MRKVLGLVTAMVMVATLGGGCGDSECDKFEKCCDAFSVGSVTCNVPDNADDDQCKEARKTFVAAVEAMGQSVPDACK